MGLFFRRRRPLMRLAASAAVTGTAHHEGTSRQSATRSTSRPTGRPKDPGNVVDGECRTRGGADQVSGPLNAPDDLPIDPTGARVRLHGVTVAEFDGSKIRSFRQYRDEAELFVNSWGTGPPAFFRPVAEAW